MIDEVELRKVNGAANPCCAEPANIFIVPTEKPDFIIRRCGVCGCNHYLLIADPGKYQRKLA